jgi:hypothetical protein
MCGRKSRFHLRVFAAVVHLGPQENRMAGDGKFTKNARAAAQWARSRLPDDGLRA